MTDDQPELPLPSPPLPADMPPLPARMINEYQYCPRLAYLEWVQCEWEDSADTVEGRFNHRRVEQSSGSLPEPDRLGDGDRIEARSLTLASERLGLIARMDLVEADDGELLPIDYKHGRRPHTAAGAHDPERVQLCVQGLILEEHGYRCPAGVLYFVESRERVRVPFDHELRAQTLRAAHGLRLMAAAGRIPPPLDDSPKCPRCSLVGICLPDEVNFLNKGDIEPRPLAVPRDDLLPLYVQAQRARISKAGETLEISVDDQPKTTARLVDLSQVVLLGNVSITTPCIHELMRREIPISWHSYGGWFLGHSVGIGHKNVELRTAQYRRSFEPPFCLGVARALVGAKIRNARTLLRRNWRDEPAPEQVLAELKRHAERSEHSRSMEELLGIEGNAAAIYFAHFSQLLKREPGEPVFNFTTRNRRPPADPINALLSFAYTLLVRTITVTLSSVGLDPYRAFYHQPRYGRPALALDMMEPFRPLIAESSVIQAINNGEVHPGDFVGAAGSVALRPDGRKRFIAAFERRLSQEITHPIFLYRASYRRVIELQARLLGRHLLGELTEFPQVVTR